MTDYETYRKHLLMIGVSENEIDKAVFKMIREDKLLNILICPDCGNEISKKRDPIQTGATKNTSGIWFNYRCDCGFILDKRE